MGNGHDIHKRLETGDALGHGNRNRNADRGDGSVVEHGGEDHQRQEEAQEAPERLREINCCPGPEGPPVLRSYNYTTTCDRDVVNKVVRFSSLHSRSS